MSPFEVGDNTRVCGLISGVVLCPRSVVGDFNLVSIGNFPKQSVSYFTIGNLRVESLLDPVP